MEYIIGMCSLCGGHVTLPAAWYGNALPRPTCEQCGAHAQEQLPTIKMERPSVKALGERLRACIGVGGANGHAAKG